MSSVAVDRLVEAATSLASASAGELPDAQVVEELLALRKLADVAEAAYLSRLAVFDTRGLAQADALSTRAWLRHHANIAPGETSRSLKTTKAVQDLPVVADALAAGDIRVPHAAAITDGASLLGTDVIAGCQDALVDAARADEPSKLRAGLRGLGAATDNRRAVREAERRDQGRWLDVTTTFDGAVHLAGVLGTEDGATIKAAINTLTTPTGTDDTRTAAQRRADALTEICRRQLNTATLPTTGGEPPHLLVITDHTTLHTPTSTRNSHANANDDDRPGGDRPDGDRSNTGDNGSGSARHSEYDGGSAGGNDSDSSGKPSGSGSGKDNENNSHANVAAPNGDANGGRPGEDRGYGTTGRPTGPDGDSAERNGHGTTSQGYRGHGGFGELPDGNILTGNAVRRLACDAKITPITTSSDSHPLNVGRTHRTATNAQRRALRIRDNGCRFPGCTRPPDWCDAHHITPWSQGGNTDVQEMILLCRKHHTTIHEHGWNIRTAGPGHYQFTNPHGQPIHAPPPAPTRHLIHQLTHATTNQTSRSP